MDTQIGLKTTALTLFLNLFFYYLPAAALFDDFSLVDNVETQRQRQILYKSGWIGLVNVVHL